MAHEEKEKEGKGYHLSPWSQLPFFGIIGRTVSS
jgi:hypothetical protein